MLVGLRHQAVEVEGVTSLVADAMFTPTNRVTRLMRTAMAFGMLAVGCSSPGGISVQSVLPADVTGTRIAAGAMHTDDLTLIISVLPPPGRRLVLTLANRGRGEFDARPQLQEGRLILTPRTAQSAPSRWEGRPPGYRMADEPVLLASGEAYSLDLRLPMTVPAGDYLLTYEVTVNGSLHATSPIEARFGREGIVLPARTDPSLHYWVDRLRSDPFPVISGWDDYVRLGETEAMRELREIGRRGVVPLLSLLSIEDVRLQAMQVLAELGTPDAVPVLLTLLRDDSSFEARFILSRLADIVSPGRVGNVVQEWRNPTRRPAIRSEIWAWYEEARPF